MGADRRGGWVWLYEVEPPPTWVRPVPGVRLCQRASTAYGNPAGMARLSGSQLLVGLQPMITTTIEFDPGRRLDGGHGRWRRGRLHPQRGGLLRVRPRRGLEARRQPQLVRRRCARLRRRVGGATSSTEVELLTFNLNPVLSYRALPWLSLGIGFSIQYGQMTQEAAINNVLEGLPDGRSALQRLEHRLRRQRRRARRGRRQDALRRRLPLARGAELQRRADLLGLGPGFQAILHQQRRARQPTRHGRQIPQEVMVSAYREMTRRPGPHGELRLAELEGVR